jgi:hypothetical protein
MSDNQASWPLVIGGGLVAGLVLVACVGLILWLPGVTGGMVGGSRFESNGEQIYFTATSRRGTPITADMGGMGRMPRSGMTCASCHGSDGRGGRIRMMMQTIEVPDIRYDTLTSEGHGDHDEGDEEEHAAYTEETIKRAITERVGPDGAPLDWPMPRWSMSETDLDDLVDFLRTLD